MHWQALDIAFSRLASSTNRKIVIPNSIDMILHRESLSVIKSYVYNCVLDYHLNDI